MKIGILGAGAMGSLVGAHAKKGGAEVYFIDVFEEHMKAITEHGLIMELEREAEPQIVFVDGAVTSGAEVGLCDVVIVLAKCGDIATAVKTNQVLFGEDTIVIGLQNGVGSEEILSEFFDGDHLGIGLLKASANILAPGRILGAPRFFNSPKGIYFAPINTTTPLLSKFEELANILTEGGMLAECTEDVEFYIWDKLCTNVMVNGIAALLHVANEDSNNHPDGWLLMRELARETCEVGQARGLDMPLERYWRERPADHVYDRSQVKTFHYVSALFDSVQHRTTEIDYLNGAVVKEGKKHGIPTPYNETVWRLVRLMQDNYDNKYKPWEG